VRASRVAASAPCFTAFALLAMLLAAIGIYGLFSHWGHARKRNAVRLLGARPSIILRWASARCASPPPASLGLAGAW
jgi:hypothetical protein